MEAALLCPKTGMKQALVVVWLCVLIWFILDLALGLSERNIRKTCWISSSDTVTPVNSGFAEISTVLLKDYGIDMFLTYLKDVKN